MKQDQSAKLSNLKETQDVKKQVLGRKLQTTVHEQSSHTLYKGCRMLNIEEAGTV